MPVPIAISDPLLAGQAVCFLAGLILSLLLLKLVQTTWPLAAQRRPGLVLSAALLVWNLGGIFHTLLLIQGSEFYSRNTQIACAFGYSGMAFLIWAILAVWRLSLEKPWTILLMRVLQTVAILAGTLLTLGLWLDALGFQLPLNSTGLRIAIGTTFYSLMLLGVLLVASQSSLAVPRICISLTLLSAIPSLLWVFFAPIDRNLSPQFAIVLAITQEQSINLAVLAAFILLARLRYTDVLVLGVFRTIGAFAIAALLWIAVPALLLNRLEPYAAFPSAARTALIIALLALFILSLPFLDTQLRQIIERKLFQQSDLDEALAEFVRSSRTLTGEEELFQAASLAIAKPFPQSPAIFLTPAEVEIDAGILHQLSFEAFTQTARRYLSSSSNSELDLFFPVRVNGKLIRVLRLSRTPQQRNLLANETQFLRSLTDHTSMRLESLFAEKERHERESRMALLVQQTTEAELRALRAQINPHFLFNALNTIADLIVTDASKAERMTERLAEVFRYVLSQSQQLTISISEEVAFLQRYLDLEKARFGDRLRVDIHVDSTICREAIPSLLLQPIIENALKHGLGPKIGPGSLSISATESGGQIRLVVEDDGVGPHVPSAANSRLPGTGLGLKNIAERLRTHYEDAASMTLQALPERGCRVTILIPRMVSA